jgi:para-nitrobenzyl esterase
MNIQTILVLKLACIVAVTLTASSCALVNEPSTAPVVQIDTGLVRGAAVDGVYAWRGIPFVKPPVNELRWRSPQPAEAWSGVRDALGYGANCAQLNNDMMWFDLGAYSEDCLNVNVWTPEYSGTEKLPVMVWIHGGGYVNGSGNIARLNSPDFAKRGVVLVTFNYRLSAFGFMTHPALAAANPDEPSGNYGLQDAVAVLEWVQNNIGAFGGDANNVTIFGESAGAGLVNTLLVAPSSADLFHKAISQSSSVGLAPEPYLDRRAGFQPASDKGGQAFARKAGIEDYKSAAPEVAAAMRALSTDAALEVIDFRDRFTPVVDGQFLPAHVGTLLAEGKQHAVPYITGGVSWEASLGRSIGGPFSPENLTRIIPVEDKQRLYPELTGPALEDAVFADLVILAASNYVSGKMAQHSPAVYRFFFSYVADARRGKQPGTAHADDIAFVLGTLDAEADLTEITSKDLEVSELMQSYWVQFAATGNPNSRDLPAWPPISADASPVLEVGDEITLHAEFLSDRLAYHTQRSEKNLAKAR